MPLQLVVVLPSSPQISDLKPDLGGDQSARLSLHNICQCKQFGKFPENLAAVYVSQVLEGLVYPHDLGVIHSDIES